MKALAARKAPLSLSNVLKVDGVSSAGHRSTQEARAEPWRLTGRVYPPSYTLTLTPTAPRFPCHLRAGRELRSLQLYEKLVLKEWNLTQAYQHEGFIKKGVSLVLFALQKVQNLCKMHVGNY